jgi:TonB family protein
VLRPGERLGDYTIVSKVGEGGMSVVYVADHAEGTRVVVKELKEQYRFEPQLIERFVRGAAILQDLRHAHLARVYAAFDREGKNFMVEEYLPGGSLADTIDRGEPFTEREALTWCRDALRALDYANEHGIVHRDVKPSNLMLDEHRRIKVIDFGIARVFGAPGLTRTGDGPIGTAEYMSPEQILGTDEVTHLTDVYSMGIVLYELLTGHVPFTGHTPFEIQEKITRHPAPPIRQLRSTVAPMNARLAGINPKLAKIIHRAIDKRPERRFGGCGEFALHLNALLKTEAPRPWIARVFAGAARVVPRAAVAVSALLAVSFLGGWWLMTDRPAGVTPVTDASGPPDDSASNGGKRDVPEEPTPAPPPPIVPAPAVRLAADVQPNEVRSAGTEVTFVYTVSNAGNVPLRDVTVKDDAAVARYRDGDANGDGALDLRETWTFVNTERITQTQLDGGGVLRRQAIVGAPGATAEVTATVALKGTAALELAALVNGVKSFALDAPGSVLFTYAVTNRGSVALTGVKLAGAFRVRPQFQGGDDGNHRLDVGETWHYRARVAITPRVFDTDDEYVSQAVAEADQARSAPDSARVVFAKHEPEPPPKPPVRPKRVPPPEKRRHVQPVYPADATSAGVQGTVVLDLTVGPDGRVTDARVVRSIPLLDRAAIDAARQWVYVPTVENGVAIPVQFGVSVNFTLTPAPAPAGSTPTRTKYVPPEYPVEAQEAGIQGTVVVVITIGPFGKVTAARVVRSIPMLDRAAVDAVRQWEFTPTFENGVAVPVTMTVRVGFSISPDTPQEE